MPLDCPLGYDYNHTAGNNTAADPWLYHPRFHLAPPVRPPPTPTGINDINAVFYSTGWYFTPEWAMKLLVSWRLLVMVFLMPLGFMRALFTHAKKPPIMRRQSSGTERALEALRYGLLQ